MLQLHNPLRIQCCYAAIACVTQGKNVVFSKGCELTPEQLPGRRDDGGVQARRDAPVSAAAKVRGRYGPDGAAGDACPQLQSFRQRRTRAPHAPDLAGHGNLWAFHGKATIQGNIRTNPVARMGATQRFMIDSAALYENI